ncbi:MAG: glycine cleavage system protein GcvH [Aestuariivita sp.]|nr:glycine cleavage system protein GcvH [Aestuariivita sp.]MCY4204055.1 glycine cleavage system protein GcvH [Aestuariivita sp.]MCY4290081.1 glycine cleavage system protein GcvH [Aestuariivita sp.]MCY4347977.1 glycine cleavage system protein GcvH [Aestuariivita sp.]
MHYTEEHEWLREEAGTIIVGITTHAAEQLGDVVFVELPEIGSAVTKGESIAVIESVKAASDIEAPLDGEIVAVNEVLVDKPEVVNSDPTGEGWFFKITPSDPTQLSGYMDKAAYLEFIK